jgi:segregation and condensation protein B
MKHHGIRLMEVAHGYQFRTKATYSKLVQNIFKVSSIQLSPTALEVLAIIAYKQPVSKSAIESIRGVDSSHVVRQLMDKRLVRICGRSEELGKPAAYGTTTEFLEIFNLSDIDHLPSEVELEELASSSDLASINQIKSIVNKEDKKRFDLDEFEELENLSMSINEIDSDTLFTKSLKDMDKARKSDDGEVKLSAFDLLETYVVNAQITAQNKEALDSENIMPAIDAKSVDTASEELFNAPQLDDEDRETFRELPRNTLSHEEAIDEAQIDLATEAADDTNANVEKVMQEMLTGEFDPADISSESKQEVVEHISNTLNNSEEAKAIEEALNLAFDTEVKLEETHISNNLNNNQEAKEFEEALDVAFDSLSFDTQEDEEQTTQPETLEAQDSDGLEDFESIESLLSKTIEDIDRNPDLKEDILSERADISKLFHILGKNNNIKYHAHGHFHRYDITTNLYTQHISLGKNDFYEIN